MDIKIKHKDKMGEKECINTIRNFPYFCLCVAKTAFQLLIMFVLQEHFVEFLVQEEVLIDDIFAASDQVLNVCNTSPITWKT